MHRPTFQPARDGAPARAQRGRRAARSLAMGPAAPVPIADVPLENARRDSTGIGELDRVLGGGLVPGAAVLLGGDPGIGKSTLLLTALHRIAGLPGDRPVLYVSGEESLRQTRLRGERLGTLSKGLLLLAEID